MREHQLLESRPIFRIQHIKAFMGLSGCFRRSVNFISRNRLKGGFILVFESPARKKHKAARIAESRNNAPVAAVYRTNPLNGGASLFRGYGPRAAASRVLSSNRSVDPLWSRNSNN